MFYTTWVYYEKSLKSPNWHGEKSPFQKYTEEKEAQDYWQHCRVFIQ